MKPVLIVDGKELEVVNIHYRKGEIQYVQVDLGDNEFKMYSDKDYLFSNDTDGVVDFEKALKFVGGHENLITELQNVMESYAIDLDDIAHEAMKTVNESPFDLKYKERQELYREYELKLEGFAEAAAIVQNFLTDENSLEVGEQNER